MLQELATKEEVHLSGDARCDSVGHSATYGLYSIMESESKKIVASRLIKVSLIP